EGKALEALEANVHARELLEAQGAGGKTYSDVLGNLVVSYTDLDRLDDALATSDTHMALLEGADEQDSAAWLFFFHARGNLMRARGDYLAAEELHRKANARASEVVGESHDLSAVTRYAAGKDLAMQGRHDEAWREVEAARDVWRELEHSRLGSADQTFGMIELQRGRPAEALVHLDAALATQRDKERPISEQFETRALRVRALWAAGR